MLKEVDFLSGQREVKVRESKISRLVFIGSVVTLISFSLLVIGIFAFWFNLVNKDQELEAAIATKKERIVTLKKVESLQQTLKERLTKLSQFFSQKKRDYAATLFFLKQVSPSGLTLTEVKLSAAGAVDVSGEAENAPVLSLFLDELNKSSLFSKVTLVSSHREKAGIYNFAVAMESK